MPGPYIVTWALSDLPGYNNNLNLPIESLYIIRKYTGALLLVTKNPDYIKEIISDFSKE